MATNRADPIDRAFSRRAGFQAYLIAAFSLVYAVVFLVFVRNHPENTQAAALASALIAGGGLAATIATTSAAARVGGDARWWLTAIGVGYGLLSAAHGTFEAISIEQNVILPAISPTDPRGLATFGLAGLWAFTLGLETVAGNGVLPRNLGWLAIVAGLDLIVGGLGMDVVHGNQMDDILVGGSLTYASDSTSVINRAALDAIMAEWRRNLAYSLRIDHLSVNPSGGFNSGFMLNSSTVVDDGVVDTLYGDAGQDWFLAGINDVVKSNKGETVTTP